MVFGGSHLDKLKTLIIAACTIDEDALIEMFISIVRTFSVMWVAIFGVKVAHWRVNIFGINGNMNQCQRKTHQCNLNGENVYYDFIEMNKSVNKCAARCHLIQYFNSIITITFPPFLEKNMKFNRTTIFIALRHLNCNINSIESLFNIPSKRSSLMMS